MNTNGFRHNKEMKINDMSDKYREKQIDVALLQEINYRWNSCGISILKRKMRKVNKTMWVHGADSGETYNSSWLPGGTLSLA